MVSRGGIALLSILALSIGQGTGPSVEVVWDAVTEAVDGTPTAIQGYEVAVSKDLSILVPTDGDARVKRKWVGAGGYAGTEIWDLAGEFGVTYRVWVRARDITLQDSAFSDPITFNLPAPTDTLPPRPPGGFRPKTPENLRIGP